MLTRGPTASAIGDLRKIRSTSNCVGGFEWPSSSRHPLRTFTRLYTSTRDRFYAPGVIPSGVHLLPEGVVC